jgi:hypothetical protein
MTEKKNPSLKNDGSELMKAYKDTKYFVLKYNLFYKIPQNIDFRIAVDQHTPTLDKILETTNCQSWAFITAFNPYSQKKPLEENQYKNLLLLEHLLQTCPQYELRYAFGVSSDYDHSKGLAEQPNLEWNPEESFVILGISREEAVALGKAYQQNAILFGEISKPTELLDLSNV